MVILRALLSRGNIRVGTSASALSEVMTAGDIIVVAGNHENQTIAVEHIAFTLLCSYDAPIAGRH